MQNSETFEEVRQLKVVEYNSEIQNSSYGNDYLNNRNINNLKQFISNSGLNSYNNDEVYVPKFERYNFVLP